MTSPPGAGESLTSGAGRGGIVDVGRDMSPDSSPRRGSGNPADLFGQGDADVRFDWGLTGAKVARADVSVIVDLFSFSTSVTIAVERGMSVFPFPWKGGQAAEFAAHHDALLAVGRAEATRPHAIPAPSLSPASLLACTPVPRLVLPSPNGSTIAAELRARNSLVVVGCLRNATAIASWLASVIDTRRSIVVVAAGERWSDDDSLRPALEDHLGAGAILSGLVALGHASGSAPKPRLPQTCSMPVAPTCRSVCTPASVAGSSSAAGSVPTSARPRISTPRPRSRCFRRAHSSPCSFASDTKGAAGGRRTTEAAHVEVKRR